MAVTPAGAQQIEHPPHQVVGDLSLASSRRIAAAVLASDAEATVCLALSPAEASFARAMGVRVCEDPRAAERSLVHLGFALVPVTETATFLSATGRLEAHPAAPLRVVIEAPSGDARSVARAVARMDLDAALVVDGRVRPAARGFLVKGGAARAVSLPESEPFGVDADGVEASPDAEACRAALRGARSTLGEQLAWDAAALLWTGAWLPRFGDILAWTQARQRRGVDLARYG